MQVELCSVKAGRLRAVVPAYLRAPAADFVERANKETLTAGSVEAIEEGVDMVSRAEYICPVPTPPRRSAMTKAKLFMTGGSQAVRLPAEFRFEGSEVDIRRDPVTSEVVLSKPMKSWDDYFNWVRRLDLPDDFMEMRDQPKDDLRDRLSAPRRKRG